MANETFTLIVVPDQATAEVRRYHFKKKWVIQAAAAVTVALAIICGGAVHYFFVARDAAENRTCGTRTSRSRRS